MEQRPQQQQQMTQREAHLALVADNLKQEVAQAYAQKADLAAAFQSMKSYAESLEQKLAEKEGGAAPGTEDQKQGGD